MDDMTDKRVKEQLDKEGVQMDDMTENRVKEQLDKEVGPNGGHDRQECPSRVTRQRRGSKWT